MATTKAGTSAANAPAKKIAAKKTGVGPATPVKTAPAKKTAAKKIARKKTPAKKTPAKKTPAEKPAASAPADRKYSPAASKQVGQEMHEMHRHQLHIGRSRKLVTNPKQAIAIGLAEARRAGKKVPPNPNAPTTK